MEVDTTVIVAAVKEAARLRLTAFESSIVAQLAGLDPLEAAAGLYRLQLERPDELDFEVHLSCPDPRCGRQLSHRSDSPLLASDAEIDCPFCSTRFQPGPNDGHVIWVPRGDLAQPLPRSFQPRPRSRLSALAERTLTYA